MGYFSEVKITDIYNQEVELTPMGEMRVITPIRFVGAGFGGTTIDTNFWSTTLNANGTATQGNNQITLTTTVDSGSSVALQSVARCRHITGAADRWRGIISMDAGAANNVRRFGAYDANNGVFFQLNGTTMQVGIRKTTSDTLISQASWNGGAFTLDTNVHTYEIYWTNKKVIFVIDEVVVHTAQFLTDTLADTLSFYIKSENVNTGVGSVVNLFIRTMSIYRLGDYKTASRYKNLVGAATTICKYGPGHLHRIVVNATTGTSITIYDNTSGAGTKIATIDPSKTTGTLEYNCEFYTGLTIVTVGAIEATVVYE